MAGCAITGGAASAILAWAVRGRSSSVFGPSFWRGPRGRRAVALTFDDGPSESTPQILDILARYNAPASFFQCGANVERLPDVARAVRQAGHDIGNHSHTHALFCFRSPRFIEEELRRAQEAIEAHTGARPAWFRAPFGARWFGVGRAQRRLELAGVMWTESAMIGIGGRMRLSSAWPDAFRMALSCAFTMDASFAPGRISA